MLDKQKLHMIEEKLHLRDEVAFQLIAERIQEDFDVFLCERVFNLDNMPLPARDAFIQSLSVAFISGFCDGASYEVRRRQAAV